MELLLGLTHGLTLSGGSVVAPRPRCSCEMKLADDGVLGVGLIGAGRIGLVHLEALSSCENAKAVIISNPTISKAEAAAVKYKLDHFTGDAHEVSCCAAAIALRTESTP
jgi:predicted homoserine dehydrogenase-like protein